ncbi:MAG TPA: FAD-dependent monooxygenase [Pseudomonadota bacterium]|nr:FAD-dependent monooxygenase [Pseudomonadota bacterium]
MTSHSQLPVLIVGAGPVGLSLACELVRHKVPFRLIDQADGPTIYSKAQILHARTLELYDDLGIATKLCEQARPARAMNMFGQQWERIAHIPIGEHDTAYPYMLNLSQRDTELILAEHLESLGGRIERKVRLSAFERKDDEVVCTLVHEGGRTETLTVRYLCGCDGAHSTVRKGLGLPFVGETYEWRLTQADVRIDWSQSLPTDEAVTFMSPQGLLAAFPLPGERRYRLIAFDAAEEPTLATFQRLLDERGPSGCRVSDPHWMVQFTIHCRQVERYRVGPVFLCGDAAHIHSPAGGQGLNTGVQDAYNLGWKLGLCYHGVASDKLLDSYHEERHPVAAAVLRGTDSATKGAGVLLRLSSEWAQHLRNSAMRLFSSLSLVQRAASRSLSELDVAYSRSPIVGQRQSTPWNRQGDDGHESPGLRDFFVFGDGPAPGARVPDIHFVNARGEDQRLLPALHGGQHHVLLFDGAAATEAGYKNLMMIASSLSARYGDRFVSHIVLPSRERPDELYHYAGSILFDPRGELHRAFGARSECLYLIRPDGYVGFRSQPASAEALHEFLGRIFS